MKSTALLLSAVLALGASPARAEEPATPPQLVMKQRGFLSGLGLGLLIGGLAGVGAGIGGLVNANEAQTFLTAYGSTMNPTVTALQQRLGDSTMLAVVGFFAGGLALAGGIICLAIDTPRASVAFVPTSQGGVFVFTGRF
jgi:hypothetical protein